MHKIPKDPVILLSYINTQLRDFYPSLEEFCKAANASREDVEQILKKIDYIYDTNRNQFI